MRTGDWSSDVCASDLPAAEIFGADLLARRRLHQRRAGEEDRALIPDDDGLVAHRGDVSAPRGAASHHAGDLRDALGAHIRLIEEDASEKIGRASGRERECQYVWISVVAGSLKKKTKKQEHAYTHINLNKNIKNS